MKHGDSIDPLFDAIETLCTVSASQPSLPESTNIVIDSDMVDDTQSTVHQQQLCVQCSRSFKTAAQLKQHLASRHLNIRPFPCNMCNSSFTQVAHLKAHRRIHSGERPFSCVECDSSFVQLSHLKTHQKLHTGEKPFVCDICAARFRQQSNLKSHRLIHTGERPYKCDQCSSSFVQVGHLKSHKRIHSNERPYKCKQCAAAFRQISNLRNHERSHLNKKLKTAPSGKLNGRSKPAKGKTFLCYECDFSSINKDYVHTHIRAFHDHNHNAPPPKKRLPITKDELIFMCSDCGACFGSCDSIKMHMKLHTGSKMYFSCSSCEQTFLNGSDLADHKHIHHAQPIAGSIRLDHLNDMHKIDLVAAPSDSAQFSDPGSSSCQVLFIEGRDEMLKGDELININAS